MTKTLEITVIAMVAVVMGMSAVAPSIQAFSVPTQTLPEQIAKDNGIDLDQAEQQNCQKSCVEIFKQDMAKCQNDELNPISECMQRAVANLRACLERCRAGGPGEDPK